MPTPRRSPLDAPAASPPARDPAPTLRGWRAAGLALGLPLALTGCVTLNLADPRPTTVSLVVAPGPAPDAPSTQPGLDAPRPQADPSAPYVQLLPDAPRSQPPTFAGLVHRWTFGEPAGALTRDVVGGVVGTLAPDAVRVHHRFDAGGEVALSGHPNSMVLLGPGVGQFGAADFSVGLWINTTTRNYNNEIVSNRPTGSHGVFFNLRMATQNATRNGVLVFELDDGVSPHYVAVESRSGFNDGAWHHVVARRRGVDAALFVDGAQVGAQHAGGVANVANGQALHLGASPVAGIFGLYFAGRVDDLQIYNRALNDGEIAAIAAAPPARGDGL